MRRALWLGALLWLGCGSPPQRHYYTLRYATPPTQRFAAPAPVTLSVRQVQVADSYRNVELVFRQDAHELRYYKTRRWSSMPSKMLTEVVQAHVRAAGVVKHVTDQRDAARPDYYLVTEVGAIEALAQGERRFAHLELTYRLLRADDESQVWQHHVDELRPTGTDVRNVVRELSLLWAQQTNAALDDLYRYLQAPDRYTPPERKVDEAYVPTDPDLFGPDLDSPLMQHPSVVADPTPVPAGLGAVIVPALSEGAREPQVVIRDAAGEVVRDAVMGERIGLAAGQYSATFGSGVGDQRIRLRFVIIEGQTTVLDPARWSALDVTVVDPFFVPFRGTYEIIAMEDRQDYGIGLGADAQQGEKTRVWVLPPGLYKIIRAGGTYRDRVDFVTVRLLPGHLTSFTLVQDPLSGDFEGAGEIAFQGRELGRDRTWRVQAILGGDVDFNRTDQVGAPEGWSLGINLFFDGLARYDDSKNLWISRLEFEESQLRPQGSDDFLSLSDRLYAHTIYTYQLVPWFGPYARVGLESKLLPRHENFDEPIDVIDADGDLIEDTVRVKLGGAFAPSQPFEGAGGNFRVLRSNLLELDVRVGLGGRHILANGLLVLERGDDGDPDTVDNVLVPVEDNSALGVESTVVALGRLTRYVTFFSEFEGLFAITDDADFLSWRNQVSLRLLSFVSLNYRFNLLRDPNLGTGDETTTSQDLQLRFSYTLF